LNTYDPTYMGVKNDTLDQVSILPGRDSVFLHKYCPTFQRHYDHLQCWAWMTLKMKAPISFETSRTARPTIWHHITQQWGCQQHQNLKCHSYRQVILIQKLIEILFWSKLLHLFCVYVCVFCYQLGHYFITLKAWLKSLSIALKMVEYMAYLYDNSAIYSTSKKCIIYFTKDVQQ